MLRKWFFALITDLTLASAAFGAFAIFQAASNIIPIADGKCNILTGVYTGIGGSGTCNSTLATCNGIANDSPAFTSFTSWAVSTWQVAHPGLLLEMDIPTAGSKCMFISAGAGNNIGAGIKRLQIVGYGVTFSDNAGTGNGFFLGGGGLAGVQQNGTTSTARLATVSAGASTVTVLDTSKCSLWSAGDWALIAGVDPMGFGYPPNPAVYEYVQINSVASCAGTGAITFNAALAKSYKSTWPLYFAGNAFQADQGGPATLYAIGQNWVTTQAYYGLTIDQAGQTYAVGQNITYRDVTWTGGACSVPTQNQAWTVVNGTMTNCAVEIDKINGTVTMQNVTVRIIDFQSASVATFNCTDCNITVALNGTAAASTTIVRGSIASFSPGSHSFGASGAVSVNGTSLPSITLGGASQNNINLRGSWAGGTLTVPHNFNVTSAANNGSGLIRLLVDSTAGYSTGLVTDVTATSGSISCQGTWTVTVVDSTHFDLQGSAFAATCAGNGGSLPLNWAVPQANVYFGSHYPNQGPVLQVADLRQDATNTYVDFNQNGAPYVGGFPTMYMPTGVAQVAVHPAPQFSCTNCTGSADAIDLSNAGAQGVPLWSYSKRVITSSNGNPASPVTIPVWGQMVGVNITVTTAYTGSTGTMHFDLNAPFFQTLTSTANNQWNTFEINAKVANATARFIGPTSTSGAQSGDTLASPSGGVNTWFLSDQNQPVYGSIPGDFGATSTTIEITTNQGVVNFLLKRDLDPSNDNSPMWLNQAA